MTDEHLHDDPVLQLVLRIRPPISDEDLSPDGQRATAILERVLGAEVASTPARRWRASPGAFLAVVLPVLGVAALVLLIAGVFSGPASTGTQPAIAAVIRGVEKATALKPGTIVISKIPGQLSKPCRAARQLHDRNHLRDTSRPGAAELALRQQRVRNLLGADRAGRQRRR